MVVLHFLFFNIFLVVWRVNCSHTGEGELLLMDGRIAIRPYMCVIRTLANIHINHVNTQKKDVMGMV